MILGQYLASTPVINAATIYVLSTWCRRTVARFIAGSKRQSLLIAGDDDETFMTRSLNVATKTREQHLLSGRPVVEITDDRRVCFRYCIEANY